ncbi:hypothetical protein Pla123a_05540 [Posidoniimonas polymericola]|uniref:Uncharacterized protein n=1 Tax=Posidoniimonas polymericola TaxID=2528002 RepID=A0A5C5ZFF1_9BACT|nr:hypothetical protein [Posidoniimonas polymericola]TWT85747.1 hypothetical protein Pla123a_05540 [Posidoniimonas polymericola]
MTQPTTGDFQQQVRLMQSIFAAMVLGPLVFALVVLLVLPGEGAGDGPLTKIGLIGGFGALCLSGPVGRVLRSRGATAGSPLGSFLTALIVSGAILEGGVFLNLLAHMQERSLWSLAMAALLWTALLFKFPAETRVRSWLEKQELAIREAAAFRK